MAAITPGDCTITVLGVTGTAKWIKVVTPATADDGDTVELSSYFGVWAISFASCATDGTVLGAHTYGTNVTLSGTTDNEARTVIVFGQ